MMIDNRCFTRYSEHHMLTKRDLTKIETIIDSKLEEKLEEKFTEKLKYLPTKDELYEKLDALMGEVKTVREEQTLISKQLSRHSDELENHEDRITELEKNPVHPVI